MSNTGIKLNDPNNTDAERARWQEVMYHATVVSAGLDAEGILLLEIDPFSAIENGVYEFLWVQKDGRIAEANVNRPRYFDSFRDLKSDNAERKAMQF